MPVSRNDRATYSALLVFLCGMPAHANNEDAIARCARIAAVGDRIVCLENALRQSSHKVAETDVDEVVPINENPVADDTSVNEPSVGAAVVIHETPVAEAAPANETRVIEAAPANEAPVAEVLPVNETAAVEAMPVNESAAAEAMPPNVDDATPADDNFGLKEKRPPKEANAVQVTVTSVRKSLTNRLIFETENGQLWLQTDQRTARYGDVPFDAEVRPASMGSFFLKPVAGGVSVRVRREK